MINSDTFSNGFWAILAIGLGSLFLLFGVKIFRMVVGIAGFGAFGFGAYILTGQVYGALGIVPQSRDLLRLGISLGAGVLGGFISVWLWKVALVSLGVLGGLGLSIYLLSWKSNGLIAASSYRTAFISLFGLAGAIASMFLETPIIIISTAIIGAISVFSGIDIFGKTGFNDAIYTLVKNRGEYTLNGKSYGMLASCGAAAALGGLVQFFLMSGKKKGGKKILA